MFGLDSPDGVDAGAPGEQNEPVTCAGCSPPLVYHGGAVMGTSAQAGAITITPIYWAPGGLSSFPTGYAATVDQYITDVAAASGSTSIAFGVLQEYSRASTGAGTGDQIKYSIGANFAGGAGAPITDTTAYPTPGCTISSAQGAAGYTTCVTDAQVRSEVSALIAAHASNQTGLQYIYPVFFPPGVEITDSGGEYSSGAWCGIHGAYTSNVTNASGPVIYAEEPYPGDGCSGSEWPQYFAAGPNQYQSGTADADGQVDILSHEINEAITDPSYNASYAWYDSTGNEIGDDCADIFGAPRGSTQTDNATDTQQSEYNQVVNGHDYWTQEMFSNATFAAFKTGQGCVQKAFVPQGGASATQPAKDLGTGTVAASPMNLAADGSSTSTVTDTVTQQDGEPVVGDDVQFSVATSDGQTGTCGTLSGGSADSGAAAAVGAVGAMTDDSGQASVTYTASTDDVACDVVASEAQGGTTDTVTINQGGTAEADAPTLSTDGVPSAITAGATPVTFTTTASNPGASDLTGALETIYLQGDDSAGVGLDSSQLSLAYSNASTGGQFVSVPLSRHHTRRRDDQWVNRARERLRPARG